MAHNWEKIKQDYVEGLQQSDGTIQWCTLDALASAHDMSNSTLRKKAAAEDWTTERNIYRTKLEQKRQDKKAEFLASKAAQFDVDVYRVVEASLKHIQGHFLVAQERLLNSQGRDPMPTTTIASLTTTLERVQRIGRLALGEPLDVTSQSSGENYFVIQEILKDDKCTERIRANFRSRVGAKLSPQ